MLCISLKQISFEFVTCELNVHYIGQMTAQVFQRQINLIKGNQLTKIPLNSELYSKLENVIKNACQTCFYLLPLFKFQIKQQVLVLILREYS